ncbi:hypothetical protein [Cryptosporangium phraense]|uniref:Uncharacterized protein n=1 Tax=Cryptosporangium phraense TaxID=2593070 RepID=A0A545ATJ1_9ACTN|nr:hypothetical protein [Cryptosporangium phraense]TQS44658.1 hypothetical protein FL583_11805 [Cryptosporangium phraense]
MTLDDPTLTAALAAHERAIRDGIVPPGGPAARATVTRRRRRTAVVAAAAAVVAVVAGIGLLRAGPGEDRAVIPAAPPSRSTAPTPSKPPAPALADDTIDFSRAPESQCGGPTIRFHDGDSDYVHRLGTVFSYHVKMNGGRTTDLTGDGKPDRIAELGCVGEGGGTGQYFLFLLTGAAPNWTVAGAGVPTSGPNDGWEIISIEPEDGGVVKVGLADPGGRGTELRLTWDGTRLTTVGSN